MVAASWKWFSSIFKVHYCVTRAWLMVEMMSAEYIQATEQGQMRGTHLGSKFKSWWKVKEENAEKQDGQPDPNQVSLHSLHCIQCGSWADRKPPWGKGSFVPMPQGKAQCVNSDQRQQYCCHRSVLIHISGSKPGCPFPGPICPITILPIHLPPLPHPLLYPCTAQSWTYLFQWAPSAVLCRWWPSHQWAWMMPSCNMLNNTFVTACLGRACALPVQSPIRIGSKVYHILIYLPSKVGLKPGLTQVDLIFIARVQPWNDSNQPPGFRLLRTLVWWKGKPASSDISAPLPREQQELN